MEISAIVRNSQAGHEAIVTTGSVSQTLAVPAKQSGRGSAINGGEFLMLALATCYCNDLYREADRLKLKLEKVEVEASALFLGIGLAATDIRYRAIVQSPEPSSVIDDLIRHTDAVAEIHNTLRAGVSVSLSPQMIVPNPSPVPGPLLGTAPAEH